MIYKYTPYFISKRLWGDRKQFGTKKDTEDSDFKKWLKAYVSFYSETQKGGLGTWVNHLGYRITRHIDFRGQIIAELGPGLIEHTKYHNCEPAEYYLVDVKDIFLEQSQSILKAANYSNVQTVLTSGEKIDLPTDSLDIVLTFNQLEHIENLEAYILEIRRVLKPGGILAGAVPCEGGLAWGTGRFLTSRRYSMKNYDFNFDKIICWEHPNFVDKIKRSLSLNFSVCKQVYSPFMLPINDINLSYAFICKNTLVSLETSDACSECN